MRIAALLALFGTLGCRAHMTFDTPIPDDGTFARATPTDEESARFEAAAAYSEQENGRALMILRGDEVIFEDYQNDHGGEEPTELYSGTKSFMCPMALLAMQDGLLQLDEPVADTITEWQTDDDPRKADIRVTDLMHFTSGLKDDFWRLTRDGLLEDQRVDDKYAVAIDRPMVHDAGEVFEYNATHPLVFGELIKRKTGRDPVEYLTDRLFDPIGMRFAGWNRDPVGDPMLAYGAWTTANEWLKFGSLVRDDGLWQGEEVMPPGAFDTCLHGTAQMPAYGLNWWLNEEITDDEAKLIPAAGVEGGGRMFPNAPDDLYAAAGANDNRLYIIPSMDLVVVRMGGGSWGWTDTEFLGLLLGAG